MPDAPASNFTPSPQVAVGPDGLTERQRRLVMFILKSMEQRGHVPTRREMMAFLGLRSTCPVTDILKMLRRKGFVMQAEPGKSHGTRLVGVRTGLIFDHSPEGQRLKSVYVKNYKLMSAEKKE
jgi:SOS-response transcriptional repressor LexA